MASTDDKAKHTSDAPARWGAAERDVVILGALALGLIVFAWTGGAMIAGFAAAGDQAAAGQAPAMTALFVINVALLVFGWRRYRQIQTEIAERQKFENQARRLAETDALTGFLNRRSLFAAADAKIAARREAGVTVAVMKIDIAVFRQMSAIHDQDADDAIVRDCAMLMRSQLPATAVIARIGQAEFVAVLAFDPRHPEQVDELAACVIEAIRRPTDIAAIDFMTSTAIGLARGDRAPDDASLGPPNAEALLRQAEIALYHARKRGRNRYFWFEPAMEHELRYRSSLETGIRRGLALGEFDPVYTPEIDPGTGKPTAFRMRARWRSATLGEVAPEIFIPVAEDIGVIGELTNRMIGAALLDAKTWDPSATLVVNISPLQLRDPWFAHHLIKQIADARFVAERLRIEIAEGALHDSLGATRALIASMVDRGVQVALDDFGVGGPRETANSGPPESPPDPASRGRMGG